MQVRNGDPFHSDHRLVIISLEGAAGYVRGGGGDRAFKFEARGLKEDNCTDVVANSLLLGRLVMIGERVE